uniref:Uncharacterized protein n=1 Tax=Ananas comosus var. bracteatus TaxID=296719 RepID=A0A6V7NWE5_ANACO|nr:unnamed protein product [Ananas comosus var. bracteatus]
MCWEIFSCCSSPTDEGTAAQKPPPPSGPPPGLATNGVSSDYAQKPPPRPSGPGPSSETNGASKPPGANPEEPPIAATAAAGGGSSSQESDKVDPAIKEGNKKSEEVKKGLKSSTKHPIDNTATDNPTKEKEQQVTDVSSEKRGHDKSADRISLQEGKPTFEHAHEAAAAAAAASSKPSSVQKNETVGLQANPRRTNQDQGRRVSTKGPGEAMYYTDFRVTTASDWKRAQYPEKINREEIPKSVREPPDPAVHAARGAEPRVELRRAQPAEGLLEARQQSGVAPALPRGAGSEVSVPPAQPLELVAEAAAGGGERPPSTRRSRRRRADSSSLAAEAEKTAPAASKWRRNRRSLGCGGGSSGERDGGGKEDGFWRGGGEWESRLDLKRKK